GQRNGGPNRMSAVCEAVHHHTVLFRTGVKHVPYPLGNDYGGDREVSASQALGHRHNVWRTLILLASKPLTSPTEAGDYLVRDQKNVVPVEHLAQLGKIAHRRNNHAAGP